MSRFKRNLNWKEGGVGEDHGYHSEMHLAPMFRNLMSHVCKMAIRRDENGGCSITIKITWI